MQLSKLLNYADKSVIDGAEVEKFITHWRNEKTLLEIFLADETQVWLEDTDIIHSPIDGQPLPFTTKLLDNGLEGKEEITVDLKCYILAPLSDADWEGA